jgi:hypothetical protein
MKKVFSILLMLAISISISDAKFVKLSNYQLNKIVHSDSRFVHSLAGKWEYSLDDEESWNAVEMPCNFPNDKKVIVKKSIKINKTLMSKKAWQLMLLGVNDDVEIYINQVFIGKYSGYGTPMNINVPKRTLIGQTNEIKLVFYPQGGKNNLAQKYALNSKRGDLGPFREILLVGTNNLWVKNVLPKCTFKNNFANPRIDLDIFVSSEKVTKKQAKKDISVDSTVANTNAVQPDDLEKEKIIDGLKLITHLIDKATLDTIRTIRSSKIAINSERTEKIHLAANLSDIKLWTPDVPNLYLINVNLMKDGELVDSYNFDYGFYKFDKYQDKLTLNGKQFRIKALTYYEDYYHSTNICDINRLYKDAKLLKILGANTVVSQGNIINPAFASFCDSIGLFILNELPVNNVPDDMVGLDEIQVIMKNIAVQTANYYQKSPSVLGIGLSTACIDNTENSKKYAKTVIESLRDISDKKIFKTVKTDEEIFDTKDFDFIVVSNLLSETNFYKVNNRIKEIKLANKNIPLVFRYGAICNPMNHNGYSDPLSIDFQAYNISNCFKIAGENNFAGNIINSFNDYPLNKPSLITNYEDRELGAFGVFSRARVIRPSLKTVQALYNEETEPLLSAGSYDEKAPLSFLVITLILLAILFVMLGRIKRFREYFVRSLSRPYNFYADIRDQKIISYSHTIILAITISFTLAIYIVSMLYINRHNEILEFILSFFINATAIKNYLFEMIWNPNMLVITIGSIVFVSFVVLAFLIKFIALLLKEKMYFTDALTTAVWSANPIIMLAVLNIINMKLLIAYPFSGVIFTILLAIFIIWTYIRILRAFSVIFDKPVVGIYIVGIVLALLVKSIPVMYYLYEYNFMSYFDYLVSLI